MAITDFLKKAGLIEDEKPEVKEVPVASDKPVVQTIGSVIGASSEELATAILGNVKSKLGVNTYFKLVESMDMMKAAKLDEVAAAKGSAALMGATAQSVGGAIDEIINALKNEQIEFENGDFASANKHASELTEMASAREQEINSLLEKVKQLSEEKAKLIEDASGVTSSASTMMATFSATVNKLVSTHESEKAKLATYLT